LLGYLPSTIDHELWTIDYGLSIINLPTNNAMTFKRLFLLTLLAAATYTHLFAQDKKGDILLGLYADPMVKRVSTFTRPFYYSDPRTIRLNGKAGYYLFDRLALGVTAASNRRSIREDLIDERYFDNDFMIGVFTRGTIPIKRLTLISELGYRRGRGEGYWPRGADNVTGERVDLEHTSGIWSYQINVGANFRVLPRLALELMLQLEKGRFTGVYAENPVTLNLENTNTIYDNSGLFLGLVYFIGTRPAR
jgi:hypothetical protein